MAAPTPRVQCQCVDPGILARTPGSSVGASAALLICLIAASTDASRGACRAPAHSADDSNPVFETIRTQRREKGRRLWACQAQWGRGERPTERRQRRVTTRLPFGLHFSPRTHPIPTEKPTGITTESVYPQNPEILHTHTSHPVSFR